MKRLLFTFYTPIILIGFIAASVWFFRSPKSKDEISLFVTIVGGLISLFYFIQKQQLEELRLFKELFTDFNCRYDRLNDDLNHIVERDSNPELSEEAEKTINDYFNLCAEEFLFYKKGYIYPEVWKAWRNGMLHFLKEDQRVRDKWLEEIKSDSYYGLEKVIKL
jgi:hypothetical protein